MKRLVLPVLAALALSACATTPTVYGPAAGPQAVGYSDYRIEPGRYRIFFRGGPGAPPAQVNDYALLRAADLALAEGYDWFRVSDRMVEGYGNPHGGPRMSVGVGGGSADYGWGRRSGTAVGVGLGTSFNLGGGPALMASLEVLMGKGPRPPGQDVYDARALSQTLRGRPV
ncbi:hypothetical protein [Phenylobacterium sp. J367]|uniref:CC0125/CC1285 family lipoprotein n=1 Tax=Phenylobacterium sp. J367 TaxID=2898435 RepID=UPI00215182A7|nr:hypothetical protein [Phenylobacterium sp. J367]MCR5880739.1 hypothetical protein [Phenylobacterium sp. J367]